DPDLVLPRVATGRVALVERDKSARRKTRRGRLDLRRGFDSDAEVREPGATGLLQSQCDGRVVDLELRVTRFRLRRLGAQQLAIERDRAVEVRDVKGQVKGVHARSFHRRSSMYPP